ncbi:MAG: tautomerase family protein [Armatimonadetes bacterium]|nr:tautomerase family protein [Armatimonadota bacterium]
MPHIQLVGPATVFERADIQAVLADLVLVFGSVETVDPASLKVYATPVAAFAVGEGHPALFLSCVLCVLGGRSVELRKTMARTVHEALVGHFGSSDLKITVEVREMDREIYVK